MDWQAELERILAKDVMELMAHEIDFLKARRDYLSGEQRAKFASVLEAGAEFFRTQPEPEQAATPEATTTQPSQDNVPATQTPDTNAAAPANGMGSDHAGQADQFQSGGETVTPQDYNGQPLTMQEPVEPVTPPAEQPSEETIPAPAAETNQATQWSDKQPEAAPEVAPETNQPAAQAQTDNQTPATDYGQLDHTADPDYKA